MEQEEKVTKEVLMGSTVSPSMTITGNIAGPPIHLIHIDTKGSEPPLLHPPQAQVR